MTVDSTKKSPFKSKQDPECQILKFEHLSIFDEHKVPKIVDLNFSVSRGQMCVLVGEDDRIHRHLVHALLGYLPQTWTSQGAILFEGRDLTLLSPHHWFQIRGRRIGYLSFESSFVPWQSLFDQIREVIMAHWDLGKRQATQSTIKLLTDLGCSIRESRQSMDRLTPLQQVYYGLAAALAGRPGLLICEMPHRTLSWADAAVFLNYLHQLCQDLNIGILLTDLDLSHGARHGDWIGVWEKGRLLEEGPASLILEHPYHPFTQALIKALPRFEWGRRDHLEILQRGKEERSDRCPFLSRCPRQKTQCVYQVPPKINFSGGQRVWCHYPTIDR